MFEAPMLAKKNYSALNSTIENGVRFVRRPDWCYASYTTTGSESNSSLNKKEYIKPLSK